MEEQERLAEFLGARAEAILRRWEAAVRAELGLEDLTRAELRNSLPRAIADLRRLVHPRAVGSTDSGVAHAQDRLRRGFDMTLVLREYELLRRCILEEWREATGDAAHSPAACFALHSSLDKLVARAAEQHAEEQAEAGAVLAQTSSELSQRIRQQAALSSFGLRALRALSIQAVFEDAVLTAQRTLGTELAKVLELSEDDSVLILRAGVGWNEGEVGSARVSVGTGSQAGFTVRSRRPVLVEDFATERRFEAPQLLVRHGVRSGVSAVIEGPGAQGSPFGVLGVHTRSARRFSEADGAFLQALANIVGASVQRLRSARQVSQERRRGDVHEFLSQAGAAFSATLDHEETLTEIARLCVQALADVCIIHLLDRQEVRKVRVVHRDEAKAPLARALRDYPLDRRLPYLSAEAIETGRETLVSELTPEALQSRTQSDEHLALLRALDPTSLMVLPLTVGARVLGALTLLRTNGHEAFGEAHLELGRPLALRAALALDGAQLYAKAQQAIRDRDELLGIVAHDLRNPLNAISLNAARILRQLPLEGRERLERIARQIQGAAERSNRLIKDLLDLQSLEAGRLSVELARVRPDTLVEEALELMEQAALDAALQLDAHVAPSVPTLRADRHRILQVLENLLGNAIKFTPAGGQVHLTVEQRGPCVRFSVSDTGPGVPPEHLPHMFDRFWQAKSAQGKGVGLGLAIARGIVESHGGRLWVESTVGQGSTFTFELPREQPQDPRAADPALH